MEKLITSTQRAAEGYSLSFLVVTGLIATSWLYYCCLAVYNLYFHPLAKFPGPFLARSTLFWRFYQTLSGRIHLIINEEHKKYGPVFRVSPNELSFSSVSSWKSIYGHQPGGMQPTKSEFYDMYGSGFDSLCIGSERVPQKHRQMKSSLSAAFSTKALLEQETIVSATVNAFVNRLGKDGGTGTKGLNMTKWYEMAAFDTLGEMAFGESFSCIERGESHFWQEMILDHLYFITVADNLRRFPLAITFAKAVAPMLTSIRDKHTGYTRAKVAQRVALGVENKDSGRKDFMSNLVAKIDAGQIGREEITAHASTLIIAGGETVATFLAATTFYLTKEQAVYQRVLAEVRERFEKYEDIDATAAQQLPYLQAVIQEGLRIYPPGSQGFPRLSNGQEVDGFWIPKGTEMYTSAWTVTHDPNNFAEPMRFNPDRWMNPDSNDVKEASQPFSLGPRGCLGRNFAMMEVNLILARIFWRYNMELVDKSLDWETNSSVHVMWSKPDLLVRFHEREVNMAEEKIDG